MSERKGEDLHKRTKQFALRIIRLYSSLPKTTVAQILGRQLLKSGTSVGAQYREAARARSRAEFVSKIESSSQELEETFYWIELLSETGTISVEDSSSLLIEANEMMAILVSSARTAKQTPQSL